MARLLFLTPQLPHPPISGGVIKSRKLVDHLASRHEVRLFTLLKGNDACSVDEFRASVPLEQFQAVPIHIPRSAGNLIRSLWTGVPLSVYRNRSSEMRSLIEESLDLADVVFVDHFLMFQYLPEACRGRVVLHQHNAEYVMWQRFAALEKRPLHKLAVWMEARRVRNYEFRIGNKADAILAAPNDIEALVALGLPRDKFILTLHLGDESLLDLPDIEFSRTACRLLYVGSLGWEANRDGLIWFLRYVWPELKRSHVDLTLTIIGPQAGQQLTLVAEKLEGVELLGFVDDLEPYYERSRVFIAPIRFGSGIKVKVVNALYRGIPVSSTSIGVEGLDVQPGRDLFVADDVGTMVEHIGILLTDKARWTQMRDACRTLMREKYTWRETLDRLEEALNG
mgnify:CR=1 FL=1